MTESRGNTKANGLESLKGTASKIKVGTMKKGYQEMADINLSLSKLYFEVEREVESYYDRIAECE
ncbi:hypothetical protein CS063_13970 [Sporanaerobium hydrogeniformans]|uniref:Uncharacterized protein n=1 Tax=Sporanaerobium hydrogeniformans TaxID=3072179 RepID=A0AC61DAM6_9FIRM|nr:hypothetical protein [Sporanaerobium hydrogeniformans]PHV69818.1 hypothetical protein CS063_13970 [Sporanaerobium hydrogeniformans]